MADFDVLILVGFAFLCGISWVITFQISEKHKENYKQKEFFKALIMGITDNSINNLDDVINIYCGMTGRIKDDINYQRILLKNFNAFLFKLVSQNLTGPYLSELDSILKNKENRSQLKQKVDEFLYELQKKAPYSDLPDAERTLLDDILHTASDANCNISTKLTELAGIIKEKNDELVYNKKVNRWSITISILGSVLTIYFGLLSLQ
jgi:hypothetical protein